MNRRFASRASAVLYWLLIAFFGFSTTVAVAVLCAVLVEHGDSEKIKYDTNLGPGWICAVSNRFGSTRIASFIDFAWFNFETNSQSGRPLSDFYDESEILHYQTIEPGPIWCRTRLAPDWDSNIDESNPLVNPTRGYVDDARGWPFRAFSCRWRADYFNWQNSNLEWGFELESPPSRSPEFLFRAVPYKPVWPGLIADTLLFALAWLGFFEFIRLVKHRCRLRRGICPRCKYQRHGEYNRPCPECGFVVRHRSAGRARG